MQNARDVVKSAFLNHNIKVLSLYSFSSKNFKRNKFEVSYLMKLFEEELKRLEKDPEVYENKIKIQVMGRKKLLPKKLISQIEKTENSTKNHKKHILNFLFGYDGHEEITDAVNNLKKPIGKVTSKDIEKNLKITTPVDLIIRTGGEKRISGFLLWMSSYSELYFSEKLWPEFTKKDLSLAVNNFKKRNRRFGT